MKVGFWQAYFFPLNFWVLDFWPGWALRKRLCALVSAMSSLLTEIKTAECADITTTEFTRWISPTGHNDPGVNKWSSPENAYNDNEDDWSYNSCDNWNNYLELIAPTTIFCPDIRILAKAKENCIGGGAETNPDIRVGVYYEDDWHTIYNDTITKNTWVTLPLAQSKNVSKVRVKSMKSTKRFYLREFDFGRVVSPQLCCSVKTQPKLDANIASEVCS